MRRSLLEHLASPSCDTAIFSHIAACGCFMCCTVLHTAVHPWQLALALCDRSRTYSMRGTGVASVTICSVLWMLMGSQTLSRMIVGCCGVCRLAGIGATCNMLCSTYAALHRHTRCVFDVWASLHFGHMSVMPC